MKKQKTKSLLALGVAGTVLVLLLAPAPVVFLALLLGLLFLPPAAALSMAMVEGSTRLSKEVRKNLEREKRSVIISKKKPAYLQ